MDIGHFVVITEGNFIDVPEDCPRFKPLRVRDITLLIEQNAADLAIYITPADTFSRRGIAVAALCQVLFSPATSASSSISPSST